MLCHVTLWIWYCRFVVFLYIFCGGLVFMAVEQSNGKSWTVIDGWYFGIVTLSTVG